MKRWTYYCRDHRLPDMDSERDVVLCSPSHVRRCSVCGKRLTQPWRRLSSVPADSPELVAAATWGEMQSFLLRQNI